MIIDEEGKIIEWSRGQEKISGIPRHQAIGEYIWDIQNQMAPESERIPKNVDYYKRTDY